MFCPQCDAADQRQSTYCRRCGQWLPDPRPGRPRTNSPADTLRMMLVFNGLNALLAFTSAVVLYATFLGTHDAKWSVYVAAAFSLVIAVHQTVSFSFGLGLRKRFKRPEEERLVGSEPSSVLIESPVDTSELIDRPSVTEKTTELLDAKPRVEDSSVSR